MPVVRILLRDALTGDEAWHSFEIDQARADDPDDPEGFYWTDGNSACDCERGRVLYAALGKPDPHFECGDSRVVIVEAFVDGVPRKWSDAPERPVHG